MVRLGIGEGEYNRLMYEAGELYFERKCRGWDRIREAFRQSRQIWAWWTQQWELMDEQIVRTGMPITGMRSYANIHLNLEHYPNSGLVKKALDGYDRAVLDEIEQATSPCTPFKWGQSRKEIKT